MNTPITRSSRFTHTTKRYKRIFTAGALILALLISSFGQGLILSLGSTAQAATIPPTVSSGVNLIIDSFTLTNASGTAKTSFAPGEAIYVRSAIRNNGTVNSKTGSKTQFYAHQPQTVAVGSKNSPEISVTHGYFNPTSTSNPFVYESRPNGTRVAQFTSTKSFSQTTPGTYVARVFADANNIQGEPNETDNQRTVTYTITGTVPTPTPTPTPAPTPAPAPAPAPNVTNYDKVRLVPESFNLMNASGQVKTSFAPNEPIYVQTTIANRGSLSGVENITTQFYKHSPNPAAVNTKDSPELSLLHGPFGVTAATTTNLYQSTPGHWSLNRFYGSTRYFTQSTPGTYTARIFVDASNKEPRDNKADNQRTVTYTITGTAPAPTPTPTPSPIPPTVNSGVNLIVDSFVLTNASGTVKTSFAPGEAIYVRSAVRNNGSTSSKTGTKTQYYAHQPSTVTVGSKNNPEISTTHGIFDVTSASSPYVYESRPNGTRVAQFTSTKSFSQTTPGTYVARVFADANNIQGEPNETDNQRTVTYTITNTPAPAPIVYPQPVQDPSGLLAVVNKKFKLSSEYVPANLRSVAMPVVNNQPLRNEAATALEQMHKDALSRGIRMHLRSGYRSYWTQNTLYNNYVTQYGRASADTFSARPGHSEHQTGLVADLGDRDVPSCDLAECFATTKSGKYVAANGHKFGFIIRYPKGKTAITGYTYEPWHLRYVGVSAATNIYNSGKTMEEYFNVPGGGY